MTPSDLQSIIKKHAKWLDDEDGGECADLRDAVLIGADLRGADLRDADLRGADLRDAVLSDAVLSGADLSGAVLIGADLRGAVLSGADLSGADLSGADLRDAVLSDAVLSGADLSGAVLIGADLRGAVLSDAVGFNAESVTGKAIKVPVIEKIHQRLLSAIKAPGCSLNMARWHTCETTHCRAGWVVAMAGEEGRALEGRIGTPAAAMRIYLASDPDMPRLPRWYVNNAEAMADIEANAERERETVGPL